MGALAGLTGEVLKSRLSEGVSWPRPHLSVAAAGAGVLDAISIGPSVFLPYLVPRDAEPGWHRHALTLVD